MRVVNVGVYFSGCSQLDCRLVFIWSPFHLGCNRTLYQFFSRLNTMIRFLSGFISSLPQLAWEKCYVVVVVVVVA